MLVRTLEVGDEIHTGGSVLRVVAFDGQRVKLACDPLTPAVRFVKRVKAVELPAGGVRAEVSRKSAGRISEGGGA